MTIQITEQIVFISDIEEAVDTYLTSPCYTFYTLALPELTACVLSWSYPELEQRTITAQLVFNSKPYDQLVTLKVV